MFYLEEDVSRAGIIYTFLILISAFKILWYRNIATPIDSPVSELITDPITCCS